MIVTRFTLHGKLLREVRSDNPPDIDWHKKNLAVIFMLDEVSASYIKVEVVDENPPA